MSWAFKSFETEVFCMTCRTVKEGGEDGASQPGPQDYSPQAPRKGPAYSIAARLPPDATAEVCNGPGVGEYHPPEPPKGPAYTIAARAATSCARDSAELPGPSDYSPMVSLCFQLNSCAFDRD